MKLSVQECCSKRPINGHMLE